MDINTDHTSTVLNTVRPNRVKSPAASDDKSVNNELTAQQQKELQQLKARDQVVRNHEHAHISAGHGLVSGGAQFTFQRGPDGIQYAIGGEVQISTSKVDGDPQATIQKAQQIRSAALAPAQPSSQDRSVASKAAQMAIEARAEIQQQNSQEKNNISIKFNSPEQVNNNSVDLIA